jgi:hypothetical protein
LIEPTLAIALVLTFQFAPKRSRTISNIQLRYM